MVSKVRVMKSLARRSFLVIAAAALTEAALGCSGSDGPLSFAIEDDAGGSDSGPESDAGSGGNGGCVTNADCDDGIPCTIDTCAFGACRHAAGPNEGMTACSAGQHCEVGKGCMPGVVCSSDELCVEHFGADPCKTDIHCDTVSAICRFSILDKDGDGHPPLVCGGGDCNDADPNVFAGAIERCNGEDDNCNGIPDDRATCSGGGVCQQGQCTCPPQNLCNGLCVDFTSDFYNCGSCGTSCKAGELCQSSRCVPSSSCKSPAIFLMQDISGSMADAGKWDAARQGIEAFTAVPAGGLHLGLGYFPVAATGSAPSSCQSDADCGQYGPCLFNMCLGNWGGSGADSCEVADYAKPAVSIASLPGNASAISASLAGRSMVGGSPLSVPLEGAIRYVRGWLQANAGSRAVVVFVTDNLPNICNDTLATAISAAQAGRAASPPVETFVIKMDGADGTEAEWTSLAQAGGTSAPFTVKTATDMRAALVAIRSHLPSCP